MSANKFFCENCHREVKASAKVCPHCGRVFTAVRCPSCSYVGQASDFRSGCPNCGYSGSTPQADPRFETVDLSAPARTTRGRIPGWVYPLAAGVLLVAFAVLVVLYLRV